MPKEPQNEESQDVQRIIAGNLVAIADILKSIRSMLTFFVVITVIVLILGACNIVLI